MLSIQGCSRKPNLKTGLSRVKLCGTAVGRRELAKHRNMCEGAGGQRQ